MVKLVFLENRLHVLHKNHFKLKDNITIHKKIRNYLLHLYGALVYFCSIYRFVTKDVCKYSNTCFLKFSSI